jgi:hypothetical protein
MMIDIKLDIDQLDGIVRAWLKETLKTVEGNLAYHYVHPDDVKQYKKDIKALKRILDYIGQSK